MANIVCLCVCVCVCVRVRAKFVRECKIQQSLSLCNLDTLRQDPKRFRRVRKYF